MTVVPTMDDVDALVAHALAAPEDGARWEVLADRLMELGDPLGEYILLKVTRPDDQTIWQRLHELGDEWQRRNTPWARFHWWGPKTGLELHIDDVARLFENVDALRGFWYPMRFRIERAHDDCDVFRFDRAHERLAWMRCWRTLEGVVSWGPNGDEDWRCHRDLTIWRVADRVVLHEVKDAEAEWDELDLRADGLYARARWTEAWHKTNAC